MKKFVHDFNEKNYNFIVQMIKNVQQCIENIAWMMFGREKSYRLYPHFGIFFSL